MNPLQLSLPALQLPASEMPNSLLANGADGISDIEGKAVTGSGEQAGTRASFNGAAGTRAT
ncbi:MAG: hypothetical protein DME99_12090 [Verrucomicrobia bacterium]|nr:MAG: hypothetical protein DME99_12090 [Verrucomicrobiota bacterium]